MKKKKKEYKKGWKCEPRVNNFQNPVFEDDLRKMGETGLDRVTTEVFGDFYTKALPKMRRCLKCRHNFFSRSGDRVCVKCNEGNKTISPIMEPHKPIPESLDKKERDY